MQESYPMRTFQFANITYNPTALDVALRRGMESLGSKVLCPAWMMAPEPESGHPYLLSILQAP